MTVRLTLICHGATAATRAGAFPTGGEPLEPRARAAIAALGPFRGRVDRAVTSPAVAAFQTAAALGLEAVPDPALRDLGHGAWAGLTLEAVAARAPDALARRLADLAAAPHGGEPVADLLERVGRWLDGLAGEGGSVRVVAVTHAAVIRAAVVRALGAPPDAFGRVDVAPLGRAVLSRSGPDWRLQRLEAPAPAGDGTPRTAAR